MKRSIFGSVHARITQNLEAKSKNITDKIPLKNIFYSSLGINILSITAVLLLQDKLPPEIPLLYGLPQGEDQLSSKIWLTVTGGLALTLCFINLAIVYILKNDFLKKTLIVTGFSVSMLSLLTTIQIVLLIGNF